MYQTLSHGDAVATGLDAESHVDAILWGHSIMGKLPLKIEQE